MGSRSDKAEYEEEVLDQETESEKAKRKADEYKAKIKAALEAKKEEETKQANIEAAKAQKEDIPPVKGEPGFFEYYLKTWGIRHKEDPKRKSENGK
jgi:hypothetical protein